MKREIKFRAKHFSGIIKEWFYGTPVPTDFGSYYMLEGKPEVFNNRLSFSKLYSTPIDEDTIGQFTGLKDNNGTEIYEGDILRVKEYENAASKLFEYSEIESLNIEDCKGNLEKEFISEVKYEDSTFFISEDRYCDTYMAVLHSNMKHTCPIFEFEVIGNIYDNPELLNK